MKVAVGGAFLASCFLSNGKAPSPQPSIQDDELFQNPNTTGRYLSRLGVEEARGVLQEGLSILLVEQNLGMAMEVATYAYILSKGKVVYGGSVYA
jgi:hypothetical protein